MSPKFWLVKSEPTVYSIDDLKRDKKTLWDGVRNYQARNYLRDMKKGDSVLFYNSVVEPIGIAGILKVTKEAVADPTQFDKKSEYYDPDSKITDPRWSSPELAFEEKFRELLTREELLKERGLSSMILLKKGSRLSVTPVTKSEFDLILKRAKRK